MFSSLDPLDVESGERAPVVIVPGIYESWKFLEPLIKSVHALGHPVHVVSALDLNVRPVPEAAAVVTAYLGQTDLRNVILLAHSKGGLIGKHVMVDPESADRVAAMIAVATPFGGSAYARFMLAPSLRIFSPRNRTIRDLAAQDAVNPRIVSIYGRFDPHIPARSELKGAKNVELDTGGHFRILAHAQVLAEFELLTP